MIVTIILSVIIILAFNLMLYSAVALIQDKRLFSTAPPDVQERILEHDERFPHAHLIGWILLVFSCLLIAFSLIYGIIDALNNHFDFWKLFLRLWAMMWAYKIYDMVFFDWFLLTKSHFYQHYFPETEGCISYEVYGFNLKSQILKLIIFPFIALILAYLIILIL